MRKHLTLLSIGILLLCGCTDDSPDFSGVRFTMNGDLYQIPRQDCNFYVGVNPNYPEYIAFTLYINLPSYGQLSLRSLGGIKINKNYTHADIECSWNFPNVPTIWSFNCQSDGHLRITHATEAPQLMGEFSYQMITNTTPADTVDLTNGIINLF